MDKLSILCLSAFCLLVCIDTSSALSCYTCSSSADSPNATCADPFSTTTEVTCTSLPADEKRDILKCGKTKITLPNGVEEIHRGCSRNEYGTGCYSETRYDLTSSTCYCDSDKCNSADNVLPLSTAFLLVSTVVTYYIF